MINRIRTKLTSDCLRNSIHSLRISLCVNIVRGSVEFTVRRIAIVKQN